MSTVAHLFAGSGGCTLGFARAGEGAEVGKFLREQQEQAAPIVDAKLAPLMKAWANLNTGRDLGGILGA